MFKNYFFEKLNIWDLRTYKIDEVKFNLYVQNMINLRKWIFCKKKDDFNWFESILSMIYLKRIDHFYKDQQVIFVVI